MIRRELGEIQARAIVIILDCCFSARALTPDGAADRGMAMPTGMEGGIVIASAAREEHALAPKGARYTTFTGELLKLLKEGDPKGPAQLTLRHACHYLKETLEEKDLPRPLWLSADGADDIVLAPNPAYREDQADDAPTTVKLPVIPPAGSEQSPFGQAPAAADHGSPTADTTAADAVAAGSMATVTIAAGNTATGGTATGGTAGGGGQAGGQRGGRQSHRKGRPDPVILVCAVAVAAVIGVVVYLILPHHAGSSGSQASASRTVSPTNHSTANSGGAACAAGTLHIVGSTAFLQLAQAGAAVYRKDCLKMGIHVTFMFTGGDSAYGLGQAHNAAVQNKQAQNKQAGTTTIGMYDGTATGSQTAGLTPYPMGVLIYSIVANKDLDSLGSSVTIGRLQNIFTGPGDPSLLVVGRRAGSGSRATLFVKLFKYAHEPGPSDAPNCPLPPESVPSSMTSCTAASAPDVLEVVNATSDAIGYSEIYPSLKGYPNVRVLKIGTATAAPGDVLNGTYSFWAIEHLYAPTQPGALAADFLKFLPQFLERSKPSDFIACSVETKELESDCS